MIRKGKRRGSKRRPEQVTEIYYDPGLAGESSWMMSTKALVAVLIALCVVWVVSALGEPQPTPF